MLFRSACSLVKGKFPSNSVIAGVPARIISTLDVYLEKAEKKSLHVGNLKGKIKDQELRRIYNLKGWL